jgi:ACS family hexuronate transporter-like MFS transporter
VSKPNALTEMPMRPCFVWQPRQFALACRIRSNPAMAIDRSPSPALMYAPSDHRTQFRWVICALLFFGTTLNYVDRQVLGMLGPRLQAELKISDNSFGKINGAFAIAYAVGQLFAGRWLDKVGTRIGYTVSLLLWSVTSMAHALVRTALGFGVARAVLGIVESPCYPANNKIAAEWFPQRERSTVMGFVNAGANCGVVVAAVMAAYMMNRQFGWRATFIGTGALGFFWLLFWIPLYRRPAEHPRVSPAELAHINSDAAEAPGKMRWLHLMVLPQTWSFAASKFITDAIWFFFIVWTAKFFAARHQMDIKHLGVPFLVIYSMADLGSIFGGWIASAFIRRGLTVNRARKLAMLICISCIIPVCFATIVPGHWQAIVLLGMATAGHQGFSANQYAIVTDMFPRRAVGSVSGFGGFVGYIGASLYSWLCGGMLEHNGHNYTPLMIIAGTGYLVAFMIIQGFAPRLEPADLTDDNSGADHAG